MTEKEKLIARVVELSSLLGREADTTGTVPELTSRISELEAELDDDGPTTGLLGDGEGALPLTVARADVGLVTIVPKVTLHLRQGHDPLLAIKDLPCRIDVEQARQVVEVEQLARYADDE